MAASPEECGQLDSLGSPFSSPCARQSPVAASPEEHRKIGFYVYWALDINFFEPPVFRVGSHVSAFASPEDHRNISFFWETLPCPLVSGSRSWCLRLRSTEKLDSTCIGLWTLISSSPPCSVLAVACLRLRRLRTTGTFRSFGRRFLVPSCQVVALGVCA